MKKATLKIVASLLIGASFCLSTLPVLGDIVYDNSTTKLNKIYGSGVNLSGDGLEFGDQIILAGTLRNLSTFTFEYFLNHAPVPGTTPVAVSPGAVPFYDSGFDDIGATGTDGLTLKYILPALLTVPDIFTFTVQFEGIAGTEVAGLELYNPPTVGNGFDDFWEKNTSGQWELKTGTGPMSFGARAEAVPEASPLTFAMMAGALWLGATFFRRKMARA